MLNKVFVGNVPLTRVVRDIERHTFRARAIWRFGERRLVWVSGDDTPHNRAIARQAMLAIEDTERIYW